MKIAIVGRMCSGKTSLSNYIKTLYPTIHQISFATKLKEIAVQLFDMKEKDRCLLQQIGAKMREIDENVFITSTLRECNKYKNIIIDDVRFENEVAVLYSQGWVLIKLNISDSLQETRIRDTYGSGWEQHISRRNDESEVSIKKISNYHLTVDVDTDDVFVKVGDYLLQMF